MALRLLLNLSFFVFILGFISSWLVDTIMKLIFDDKSNVTFAKQKKVRKSIINRAFYEKLKLRIYLTVFKVLFAYPKPSSDEL